MREYLRKNRMILTIGLIIITLFLPLFVNNSFYMRVLVNVLIYVLLASSLNVINGYSGQFNIGHAGFYCVGAYTAAILATRFGLSFWLLLPISGLMAALFSTFLGLPTLRLKGIFLAITTLGFSEIIRLTVLNWTSLTRGPMGIPGIPFPELFGIKITNNTQYYYIILFIVFLMLFITNRILKSRIGRAWIAIREDELAAKSMGVETFKYKLLNFAYGTFWAGVAGCFYAFFSSYVSADSFILDEGFSILGMVIVGGQGTLIGPIIGATFLTILPELVRSIAEYRLLIFGAAIVITMLVRPQGIAGSEMLSQKLGRGTKKKKTTGGGKDVSAS